MLRTCLSECAQCPDDVCFSLSRVQSAGAALEELLVAAKKQDYLTVGVYESAKVMNVWVLQFLKCLTTVCFKKKKIQAQARENIFWPSFILAFSNSDPDSVAFCVLATDEEYECDIALQIHFTLIQAFCFDNDINVVRVNDIERLADLVGADETGEPKDAHCILVTVRSPGAPTQSGSRQPVNHACITPLSEFFCTGCQVSACLHVLYICGRCSDSKHLLLISCRAPVQTRGKTQLWTSWVCSVRRAAVCTTGCPPSHSQSAEVSSHQQCFTWRWWKESQGAVSFSWGCRAFLLHTSGLRGCGCKPSLQKHTLPVHCGSAHWFWITLREGFNFRGQVWTGSGVCGVDRKPDGTLRRISLDYTA